MWPARARDYSTDLYDEVFSRLLGIFHEDIEVTVEKPGININQGRRGVLMLYWCIGVLICCVLPTYAAQQLDACPVCILQVSPHSSAY